VSTENNPPENDTMSADELARMQHAIETLTRQRDKLAEAKRAYADGDTVDLSQVRLKARQAIDRVLPAASAPKPENEPIEYSARDLLLDYWAQATKRVNTAGTSFKSLNEALSGGIEAERLVVLLGAPNTGKTVLAHQIADYIADSGRPVLYVTSEDRPGALIAKTLARVGGIDYTPVLKGRQDCERAIKAAIARQLDRVSAECLRYLDATNGVDMATIRDRARSHFERYSDETQGGGPGVLVVDYLQRIARAMKTRNNLSADLREVVTRVGEELRGMAMELNCGVIAIASQNRTGYTRGESTALASAKESGDIEYCADVLLALVEDKDRKKTVPHLAPIALHVDKNRQGKKDIKIALDFYADRQQFTEAAQ
jgi:replicative DNA helicase